jgi:C1A family cysteine protease
MIRLKALLILAFLVSFAPRIIVGQEKYDTINYYNYIVPEADRDTAVFNLSVKNLNNKPLPLLKVYLVDQVGKNVYTSITDLKGAASFFIPTGRTYVVDINETKAYKEFNLPKIKYLTQTYTLMYDPDRFKSVAKKEILTNPKDTIYQFDAVNMLCDQRNGKVELVIKSHKKKVLSDLPVFLYDPKTNICYASKTNSKGIAFFLVPVGTKYAVCFSDFLNYIDISLPNYPFLNTQFQMVYTPTEIDENIMNDTIYQRFELVPEPTPNRGLLSVKIVDHKNLPIDSYPILIQDTRNDSVFISYTGIDGLGFFLLPKGVKYRLSYSIDKHADYIYFKDDGAYSSCSIVFQSSGLVLDEALYEEIEMITPLTENLYHDLPSSSSLVSYCPPVGDQGQYGTCVGWATAYYAHYILEASSKIKNPQELYSPTWVYENIKAPFDINCTLGSNLEKALKFLQHSGDISIKELPYSCGANITSTHRVKASKNTIKEFRRLFDWGADGNTKIKQIKKSLAEKKPVVIGFSTNNSFYSTGDLWEPKGYSESFMFFGGHAMTVVAFDDSKYGGAFLLINSWGEGWGNKGYCWVRYSDFTKYCFTAFELFGNLSTKSKEANQINVELKLTKPLNPKIKYIPSDSSICRYKVQTKSLKDVELEISTQFPSYVYILGINSKGDISDLNFGAEGNFSAYLGYNKNTILTKWKDLSEWRQLIFVFTKNRDDYLNIIQPLFNLKSADYNVVFECVKKNRTKNNQYSTDNIEVSSIFQQEGEISIFGVEFEIQ